MTTTMTKRQFLQMLGISASALGMSVILGSPARAATGTPPAWDVLPEGATPKTGGKLIYGQTYPNWALGVSDNGRHPYYWMDLLTRSVWNCLLWVDHNFALQGELAESWAPTDETLKVWDFKLREGVLFHDGTEMTAADAVASLEAHVAQQGSGFVHQWFEKAEVLDRYSFRTTLNASYSEWPWALAEYRITVSPAAGAENILATGIGTGPFKIVDIDNRRGFQAVRNENYWLEGRPFADEVEGYIVNSQSAINGFRSGQFNAVFNIDPVTAGQYETAGGIVHKSAGGDQFLLGLAKNLDLPWNDPRVREAMSLSIDRDRINTIVYNDPSTWVGNDTHMSGINPEFVPRPVAYDPARAKALLAEAGYPDGITLPTILYTASFPEEPRVMAIVAESLKENGITVELREMPADGYRDYTLQVNTPIGRPSRHLVGPRNPAINLGRMVTNPQESAGWTGEIQEKFVAQYQLAIAEPDDAKRFAMYGELQTLIQSDTPAIVLGGRRNMLAHSRNVHNLRSHSQNWSSRFDDFWIDG